MNIHFEQAEKKSQVLLYVLVIVVPFTVWILISNTSSTFNLHLPIHPSFVQRVHGDITNTPVAIAAPLPPAEQVQEKNAPVTSSTPSPVPQPVPVPMPSVQ